MENINIAAKDKYLKNGNHDAHIEDKPKYYISCLKS